MDVDMDTDINMDAETDRTSALICLITNVGHPNYLPFVSNIIPYTVESE
jgi:hypothetical protein